MTIPEFNFIERYRTLMPAAPRDVVDARQGAHTQLFQDFPSKLNRMYVLVALAFGHESLGLLLAEFEKAIHDLDPQFILNIDRAEGARIAALLLENAMHEARPITATAILAASFCGRRTPAGGGKMLELAHQYIERTGSTRQAVGQSNAVSSTSPDDLKASLDAMVASLTGQTVRTVIEALLGEVIKTQQALAKSATTAIRAENISLAQEVDMLWWNMGNWSDVLGKSRRGLAPGTAGLVAGQELARFVGSAPGPYGVYGILRHALGDKFNEKTTLTKAVTELKSDAPRLARSIPSSVRALFPVTAAIAQAAVGGKTPWDELADDIGDVADVEVTNFELAIQGYREAILISWGGLE